MMGESMLSGSISEHWSHFLHAKVRLPHWRISSLIWSGTSNNLEQYRIQAERMRALGSLELMQVRQTQQLQRCLPIIKFCFAPDSSTGSTKKSIYGSIGPAESFGTRCIQARPYIRRASTCRRKLCLAWWDFFDCPLWPLTDISIPSATTNKTLLQLPLLNCYSMAPWLGLRGQMISQFRSDRSDGADVLT